MDAQLRRMGEACVDHEPVKRPAAEVLSKVSCHCVTPSQMMPLLYPPLMLWGSPQNYG